MELNLLESGVILFSLLIFSLVVIKSRREVEATKILLSEAAACTSVCASVNLKFTPIRWFQNNSENYYFRIVGEGIYVRLQPALTLKLTARLARGDRSVIEELKKMTK